MVAKLSPWTTTSKLPCSRSIKTISLGPFGSTRELEGVTVILTDPGKGSSGNVNASKKQLGPDQNQVVPLLLGLGESSNVGYPIVLNFSCWISY